MEDFVLRKNKYVFYSDVITANTYTFDCVLHDKCWC